LVALNPNSQISEFGDIDPEWKPVFRPTLRKENTWIKVQFHVIGL